MRIFLNPGSLRIGPTRPSDLKIGQESAQLPATHEQSQPYLARLVLLVPAEVIALYVSLQTAATGFLEWFGLACLLLVGLVRLKATAAGGHPEWLGVLISMVTFTLWLYATGGSLPGIPSPKDPGVMAVSIGVWTFVVPYFYQGATPPTPPTPPVPDPNRGKQDERLSPAAGQPLTHQPADSSQVD